MTAAQGLTPEQAVEFVAPFGRMLDERTLDSSSIGVLVKALKYLPEPDRRRFLRGRHTALWATLAGTPNAARSTAYHYRSIYRVQIVLIGAGLLNDDDSYRDLETGRKVKTILAELARLEWESDDALIDAYRTVRDGSLRFVKAIIAADNYRSRTFQSLDGAE